MTNLTLTSNLGYRSQPEPAQDKRRGRRPVRPLKLTLDRKAVKAEGTLHRGHKRAPRGGEVLREVGETLARATGLLNAEEEARLIALAQQGDTAAEQRLVSANGGLCHRLARRYATSHLPYDDAFSEAALGLLVAIRRFDPSKGCRLSTIAVSWMVQHLNRALDNQTRQIRLPSHVIDKQAKIERAELRLLQRLGRHGDESEVAEEAGLSARELQTVREVPSQPLSLDSAPTAYSSGDASAFDGDGAIGNTIADEAAQTVFDSIPSEIERSAAVVALLARLSTSEADVLRRRYGFAPYYADQSLQVIATDRGCSRENVRQIEMKAIKKCRRLVLQLGIQEEDLLP